jgi:type II secretory ATPase GspE/PulE/Tfp pilus assembly ATPase PilB-like protein
MEVLPIDDDVRAAILRHAISAEIRDVGISKGMITLLQGALARVKEGQTSLDVALKVAGAGE